MKKPLIPQQQLSKPLRAAPMQLIARARWHLLLPNTNTVVCSLAPTKVQGKLASPTRAREQLSAVPSDRSATAYEECGSDDDAVHAAGS
jgi:hypothetical protein